VIFKSIIGETRIVWTFLEINETLLEGIEAIEDARAAASCHDQVDHHGRWSEDAPPALDLVHFLPSFFFDYELFGVHVLQPGVILPIPEVILELLFKEVVHYDECV